MKVGEIATIFKYSQVGTFSGMTNHVDSVDEILLQDMKKNLLLLLPEVLIILTKISFKILRYI